MSEVLNLKPDMLCSPAVKLGHPHTEQLIVFFKSQFFSKSYPTAMNDWHLLLIAAALNANLCKLDIDILLLFKILFLDLIYFFQRHLVVSVY